MLKTDGFQNVLTGLGQFSRDKRLSAGICQTIPVTDLDCGNLFNGNDVAKRLAAQPAIESFREGIEICVDDDPETRDDMHQLLDTTGALSHMTWCKTLANVYGGAGLFVGADDGQDPAMPLNLKRLKGKGVRFMTVYDKTELRIAKRYETLDRYGEPELYELISSTTTGVANGRRIHESRVIHLDGVQTTRQWSVQYQEGWGASVYQHTLGVLRGYSTAWDSAEALMQDFAQAVYKIKDLANLLSEGGESAVIARLQTIDASRSILRAILIDAEQEDFSRQQTPISGLPELLDRWMHRVAAAAGMPITVLFGMSPGGMNATGDSDMRMWYDAVKSEQQRCLRRPTEKLLRILFSSLPQGEPSEWHFKWNPLWQPSQAEKQQAKLAQAQIDKIYSEMDGGLTGEEIITSRFGGAEGYSYETQLDDASRAMMAQHEQAQLTQPETVPNAPATTTEY